MTYALTPHTFVCIDRQRAVILDLMQDRYMQMRLEDSNRLAGYILGWPAVNETTSLRYGTGDGSSDADGSSDGVSITRSRSEAEGEVGRGLVDLARLGLITAQTDPTEPASRVLLPAAQRELLSAGDALSGQTWLALLRCYKASRLARRWLRTLPLHEVVQRARALRGGNWNSTLDVPAAQHVVKAFLYLRPFLRSSKDSCLIESLSLLHALSLYGIQAHWVFGVRTEPFFAHCWLQIHDCVLNDSVDRVGQFTPIMIV